MPELPDVEVYRRRIQTHAKGKTIKNVSLDGGRILKKPAKKIAGIKNQKIQSVQREGKYCMLDTGKKGWLVLHFGMTGEVAVYPADNKPPDYTVLSLEFKSSDNNLAITSIRKLGKITLTGSPEEFKKKHDIGMDALVCSKKDFTAAMKKKKGSIKSALMDQSTISGIGNIYSDEILFQARIHPGKKVNELEEKHLKKLYDKMQKVLDTAISSDADPEKLPDDYLIPHRAKSEKCPSCNSSLKSIKISGRKGWYCPDCQSK